MRRQRLEELDILKVIAFVFVVAQHILGKYSYVKAASHYDSLILSLLYVIARPAVPIFVALSAMALFYTYSNNFNALDFYKKRVFDIVIPYIIWSIVNMLAFSNIEGFRSLIPTLITGNGAYHLWYMGMIFRVYLYFPIILLIGKYINSKSALLKALFLIIFSILYWVLLKNNNLFTERMTLFLFKYPNGLNQRFVEVSPVLWSIYFVIGCYIIFNYNKFKELVWKYMRIIIFSYALLLMYSYYQEIKDKLLNPPFQVEFYHSLYISFNVLSILVFYILSLYIARYKKELCEKLRVYYDYSYACYLSHAMILAFVEQLQRAMVPVKSYLLSGLIIFITSVVITPQLCSIVSLVPYSQYILGTTLKSEFVNARFLFAKCAGLSV